jgi:hypothetical protein
VGVISAALCIMQAALHHFRFENYRLRKPRQQFRITVVRRIFLKMEVQSKEKKEDNICRYTIVKHSAVMELGWHQFRCISVSMNWNTVPSRTVWCELAKQKQRILYLNVRKLESAVVSGPCLHFSVGSPSQRSVE